VTIKNFIDKWSPINEPDLQQIFLQDFWSVIDKLGDDRFRQVAIEVLSDIDGAKLEIYTQENPELNGVISWSHNQTVFKTYYSVAVGQQSIDWFYLLREIAKHSA
jgi:hypothetical protein